MAKRFFVLFLLISLYFSIPVSSALAYYTNMSADVVIGQPDFISNSSTTTQNSLSNPLGVFSDGTHLFVSDGNNNRVLIWNSIPTKNGTAADIVLGQPDFISSTANNGGISARTLNSAPYCVYSDGTHLVVCDQNNRRVLIWNSIPTTNQQAADVVVGQPDFVTSSAGTTASKFTFAIGALIYNGKLIVADTGNNRVLIFNSIPKTNGASADVVIGNTNFTSITSGTTASTFGVSNGTGPRGIVMIDGKLIVDDPGNRRVLIFNSLPTTNGVSADVVVGEPDFTTRTAEADLGISCARLNGNETVASAANGRLVIGDNHRVLIFNQIPTSNGASADIVLGQSDCVTKTANNGGLSASSLNGNIRPGVEVNNKLFVADSSNSRLLIFNNVISTPVIGLYPFPEAVGNGRLRMRGNVRLGEWERYILSNSKMEVSVNGGGYGAVSSLYGNREDTHDNLYEFFHEFDPSPIPGGTEGYT
ncbi:hypothetical protein HYT59_02850, partial [Candidatus Woesebacteria bacterium]|nr:hypothetical protein [Candidatus Woesebacteria bacterium]